MAVECVVESAQAVGTCTAGLPSNVLPLLDQLQEIEGHGSKKCLAMARDIMRCARLVGEKGLKTVQAVQSLVVRAEAMRSFLVNAKSVSVATPSSCRSLVESL